MVQICHVTQPEFMNLFPVIGINPEGQTIGGHVLEGCIVRTTAEIVVGELADFTFSRKMDEESGYRELVIQSHAAS